MEDHGQPQQPRRAGREAQQEGGGRPPQPARTSRDKPCRLVGRVLEPSRQRGLGGLGTSGGGKAAASRVATRLQPPAAPRLPPGSTWSRDGAGTRPSRRRQAGPLDTSDAMAADPARLLPPGPGGPQAGSAPARVQTSRSAAMPPSGRSGERACHSACTSQLPAGSTGASGARVWRRVGRGQAPCALGRHPLALRGLHAVPAKPGARRRLHASLDSEHLLAAGCLTAKRGRPPHAAGCGSGAPLGTAPVLTRPEGFVHQSEARWSQPLRSRPSRRVPGTRLKVGSRAVKLGRGRTPLRP